MTSLKSGVKMGLMKKLSTYLFLILFSFSAPSFADDIRDFEIEGISVGDSLLDYFEEEEIKKAELNYYNDNEFVPVYIEDENKFSNYSGVQFHYKNSDENFKIFSIEGIIWFKNNFDGCIKKQKEIDEELKTMFPNTERQISGIKSHRQDKSGKSKFSGIDYFFQTGDITSITCYDWTKKMKHPDNLRVGIITEEFQTWINTKAYE